MQRFMKISCDKLGKYTGFVGNHNAPYKVFHCNNEGLVEIIEEQDFLLEGVRRG
jgi:hypothetical protein